MARPKFYILYLDLNIKNVEVLHPVNFVDIINGNFSMYNLNKLLIYQNSYLDLGWSYAFLYL